MTDQHTQVCYLSPEPLTINSHKCYLHGIKTDLQMISNITAETSGNENQISTNEKIAKMTDWCLEKEIFLIILQKFQPMKKHL